MEYKILDENGLTPEDFNPTEELWKAFYYHINIVLHKEEIVVHSQEEIEDDDFRQWVHAVHEAGKRPKNEQLRKFLSPNRWERNGRG